MRAFLAFLLVGLAASACSGTPPTPVDDPDFYPEDPSKSYELTVGEPRWIIPSAALPQETVALASNNNVDIMFFEGRLFLAWRTNDIHFASENAKMHLITSTDEGKSWSFEHTIAIGADVREPRFLSLGGRLFFHYFEAGTDLFSFEPKRIWRTERLGHRRWTEPVAILEPGEVLWDMKVRKGRALLTSYLGEHYGSGMPTIEVFFRSSTDGVTWTPVDPAHPVVYTGGVSEVAIELENDGTLWAVTRNEDGDTTGFGSHLCKADAASLAVWDCPAQSSPYRYDSPQMFRHNGEIYLVARRDPEGPFDMGIEGTFEEQRQRNLIGYSARPKRTAVYKIDRAERKIVHLLDLPSAGDTAFPAVRRLSEHSFLVANYTSPLHDLDRSWIVGQTSTEGTQIYLIKLTFVPK